MLVEVKTPLSAAKDQGSGEDEASGVLNLGFLGRCRHSALVSPRGVLGWLANRLGRSLFDGILKE